MDGGTRWRGLRFSFEVCHYRLNDVNHSFMHNVVGVSFVPGGRKY